MRLWIFSYLVTSRTTPRPNHPSFSHSSWKDSQSRSISTRARTRSVSSPTLSMRTAIVRNYILRKSSTGQLPPTFRIVCNFLVNKPTNDPIKDPTTELFNSSDRPRAEIKMPHSTSLKSKCAKCGTGDSESEEYNSDSLWQWRSSIISPL